MKTGIFKFLPHKKVANVVVSEGAMHPTSW